MYRCLKKWSDIRLFSEKKRNQSIKYARTTDICRVECELKA